MQYATAEATGKEGYPQAQGMWLSEFPEAVDLHEKYPWYYGSESFQSRLYLLKEGGTEEVVGAIGFVSRLYHSRNGDQVVGLCSDFAVDKSHQTVVPALQLLKSLLQGSRNQCDLLLGFPNNKSVLVMRRAGFHVLGVLPRYALILKSGPYIDKLPIAGLGKLITAPIDALLKTWFRLTRCAGFSSYKLTEISAADESFDKLWAAWSKQSDLYAGRRDSKYINWRFFANPLAQSRVFALTYKKTHEELLGYAVIRVNAEGHWHVFDFFARSGNKTTKCLLQKLIAVASSEDATSLSLEFLGEKKICDLLRKLKFSQRDSDRRVILSRLKESSEDLDHLYDVNNWYITSADELG